MVTMGWILSSFRWGYAFFQIPGGWLGDQVGPRAPLPGSSPGGPSSLPAPRWPGMRLSMVAVRFLFGVGEAGAFPIATRSLSRWLLPAERGFAQGLPRRLKIRWGFDPLARGETDDPLGWRSAFMSFGVLGLLWGGSLVLVLPDTPPSTSRESGRARPDSQIPWRGSLAHQPLRPLESTFSPAELCGSYP